MHASDTPVFHVQAMGCLAHRMMQYMVALKFRDIVPECRISGVSLPSWGIEHPALTSPGPVAAEDGSGVHADLVELAEKVWRGEIRRIEWGGFAPRMEHFLPAERYRHIFSTPPGLRGIGYGPDTLVCPIRGDAAFGSDGPGLTPVEFYRGVVETTGLQPVFIGETEPNADTDRLRAAFPYADFRAPQSDPMIAFETMRQSRHIAVGVSLSAWLAAWLAEGADTVFMALRGPFNPRQNSRSDLLPFGDRRFRFVLFPIIPLTGHAAQHALGGREIPHDMLQQLLRETPRFPVRLTEALAVFDEAFYLAANADVAEATRAMGAGYGRSHYIRQGFDERRPPLDFDPEWYAGAYPMADFEVAQGDHLSLLDHYIMVGRHRGYTPRAPEQTESRAAAPLSPADAGDKATRYRFSLVACARWDEQDIQEWVEYHRSVGFDHIYLYSNDDEPEPLFKAVAPWVIGAAPFITFRYWPSLGDRSGIYLHFLQHFRDETEWFSFLDIDEFFVFRSDNNVARFMRDYQNSVDCLYFNRVVHGHNGKLQREPGFTLTNYPRRPAKVGAYTRMLCRSRLIDPEAIRAGLLSGGGAFHHFLDNCTVPGLRCADVLHGSTAGYSAQFPESAEPFINRSGYSEAVLGCAYIAHFQFRSEEDFMRRWRRGRHPEDEMWRRLYETGGYRAVLAGNNAVYDSYLADYWHRHTAHALRFVEEPPYGAPPFTNVARNKPCFQSSVYQPAGQEPKRSRVSGGGNNGMRTGTYGFHTQHERQPWWCVDLLRPHRVAQIHIYNRVDDPAVACRAAKIEVLGSLDTETWVPLAARQTGEPFGMDGKPLVMTPGQDTTVRFVLLRLPTVDYLHLDEVEIYGEPL